MAKSGNAALQQFAAKRGNVPALKIGLGVLLILIFLLALMLQVQTSEAFLLNSSAVGLSANWAILKQPFELAQGVLSLQYGKSRDVGMGHREYLSRLCSGRSLHSPLARPVYHGGVWPGHV